MKNFMVWVISILIILIVVAPICFGCGYLSGMFLKFVCGEAVTNGLNMILGNITQHAFIADDIPLFCAIMTTIGGFFKSTLNSKEKDNS